MEEWKMPGSNPRPRPSGALPMSYYTFPSSVILNLKNVLPGFAALVARLTEVGHVHVVRLDMLVHPVDIPQELAV